MSKPFAGNAMALRCVCVMRGISKPFVVDLISNNDELLGVIVPMPAAPLEGNLLVCAVEFFEMISIPTTHKIIIDFSWYLFLVISILHFESAEHLCFVI